MDKPKKVLTFRREGFRNYLKALSFKDNGDALESQHHALLEANFPRIQEFWRLFVVPLTLRVDDEARSSFIGFREGIDSRLQYISGANYSVFVHLAYARLAINNWNETSADVVYTRLASAFDVFEGLVIKFYLLLCDCRCVKSPLLDALTKDDFLKIASKYYDEEYATLHKYYAANGKKPPPITIPSKGELVDEFFAKNLSKKAYRTISREIRTFRNVIVHDVRIGSIEVTRGEILVPKTEKVSSYREWTAIEAVLANPDIIARDFREVKAQCEMEMHRSTEVLNSLYETILAEFTNEFYKENQTQIRDLWGIKFDENQKDSPSLLLRANTHESSSFNPYMQSGCGLLGQAVSGAYAAPQEPKKIKPS